METLKNTKTTLQIRHGHRYRTGTGIMMDVLNIVKEHGMDGAKISEISRRANISHYAVLEKCQKMINAELLRSITNKRSHIYIITEKGIMFVQQMEKFLTMIQAIGIRV